MQVHDLKVRVSTDLKNALQSEAEANSRSMNGEITQILKKHFGVVTPPSKRLVLRKPAKAGA